MEPTNSTLIPSCLTPLPSLTRTIAYAAAPRQSPLTTAELSRLTWPLTDSPSK